jgi:hypothetical protein
MGILLLTRSEFMNLTSVYVILFREVVLALPFFVLWLFLLLHAVTWIDEPERRVKWVLLFLLLNILCIPVYAIVVYYGMWKVGKRGLIRHETGPFRRILPPVSDPG